MLHGPLTVPSSIGEKNMVGTLKLTVNRHHQHDAGLNPAA
jgi:hypothetical protein